MALEFRLPDVGEGISEAEILEWHVAAGERVTEDAPLADIQTDKAVVTIPVPTDGVVERLCAEVGDVVPVGELLVVIGTAETAEDVGEPAREAQAAAPAGPSGARAAAAAAASAPATGTPGSPAGRPLASPAVRRLARDRGVDLRALAGSGPGGRILRADVEAAAAGAPASTSTAPVNGRGADAAAPATPAHTVPPRPAPVVPGAADDVIPLRGRRRAIARTLTQAWQTIPHVIDYREVDATELVRARRGLKARAERGEQPELARALTMTPLLVKIVALALQRHPYVNASVDLEAEQIVLRRRYHIGIATAAREGLIVPVVHDADRRSVADIALEIATLTAAARENRLTREQLAGGTFTVNNYGGLGIWLGTPIIRPPEVANLGVGRMEDRAVVRDGEVVVRPIVPLAVSGDHRILDGDTLAAFVSAVVELMEDPLLLLVELR